MLSTQKLNKNTEEVVLPMQGEKKALPCFGCFLKNLQPFLYVLIFSWISQKDDVFRIEMTNHNPLNNQFCPKWTMMLLKFQND